PFQFIGQAGVMREGNGLDFMRQRYYSPAPGRFSSADPLGFTGSGTNLLAYVGNNPVTGIDPQGLWSLGGVNVGTIDFGISGGQWLGGTFGIQIRENVNCL